MSKTSGWGPGVRRRRCPLEADFPPSRCRQGRALEVRVSDCIPLNQRGSRRLVSVEHKPEQPEPDFRCSRGAFTLLWPSG